SDGAPERARSRGGAAMQAAADLRAAKRGPAPSDGRRRTGGRAPLGSRTAGRGGFGMTDRLKRTRHPGIFEAEKAYIVRYRDLGGRQRQKTCQTLDEAKRFRAKVTLNPAAVSPRSGPTVSEYAE